MSVKPLVIGNHVFPTNLIQGPLAGVSCAPFRKLIWKFSQPAFVCSEMISAKTVLQLKNPNNKRYLYKDPKEKDVCYQLSATDPLELAEATKIITDQGASLIDLNCGCPVKKIRDKNAGSKHLSQPLRLYHLIQAMKQHTHLPVGIKIRVDANIDSFNSELIKVLQESGLDFLIVHGRHWSQDYSTPCHYDEICFFVESLSIPVIGNGDVADRASLERMLATGCAGAMLSRAGCGQPWLIAQMTAELTNQSYQRPDEQAIKQLFYEHARGLVELLQNEKQAIMQMRKVAKYYARHFQDKLSFVEKAKECESLVAIDKLCGGQDGRKLGCVGF